MSEPRRTPSWVCLGRLTPSTTRFGVPVMPLSLMVRDVEPTRSVMLVPASIKMLDPAFSACRPPASLVMSFSAWEQMLPLADRTMSPTHRSKWRCASSSYSRSDPSGYSVESMWPRSSWAGCASLKAPTSAMPLARSPPGERSRHCSPTDGGHHSRTSPARRANQRTQVDRRPPQRTRTTAPVTSTWSMVPRRSTFSRRRTSSLTLRGSMSRMVPGDAAQGTRGAVCPRRRTTRHQMRSFSSALTRRNAST